MTWTSISAYGGHVLLSCMKYLIRFIYSFIFLHLGSYNLYFLESVYNFWKVTIELKERMQL